jgi:hypothetical protein
MAYRKEMARVNKIKEEKQFVRCGNRKGVFLPRSSTLSKKFHKLTFSNAPYLYILHTLIKLLF